VLDIPGAYLSTGVLVGDADAWLLLMSWEATGGPYPCPRNIWIFTEPPSRENDDDAVLATAFHAAYCGGRSFFVWIVPLQMIRAVR
jgi:hypothetical protein